MFLRQLKALAAIVALTGVTACAGQSSPSLPGSATAQASEITELASDTSRSSDTPYTCPSAETSHGALDCTKLPLGDRKYLTTGAKAGYIYSCSAQSGEPVVSSAPWLDASTKTWNLTKKIAVEGAVSWDGKFSTSVSGSKRTIDGNGLPIEPHDSGIFPISSSDPAYEYDHNPNRIETQNDDYTIPSNPTEASKPSCLSGGAIGITVTGVAIYDAYDAAGYDAVAREMQDGCHGHPDGQDEYHYHGDLQACVPDAGSAKTNSSLLGYALDGFGIYGPWYNGKILTTADLDECHGITSVVNWNGKNVSIYHYVSTYDYPYTLGCYRGTPTKLKQGPPGAP